MTSNTDKKVCKACPDCVEEPCREGTSDFCATCVAIKDLLREAETKGGIKALAHVLVHGATGRKHIGLSRPFVVSYLAEKQQDQKDLWELRGEALHPTREAGE